MRVWIVAGAVAAVAQAAACSSAQARWRAQYASAPAKVRQWFSRQRSIDGTYCCSQADGIVEGTNGFTGWWHDAKGYHVVIDGFPLDVPPGALTDYLHDGNPNDGAVVWPSYTINSNAAGRLGTVLRAPTGVLCFTPASQG